MYIMPSMSNLKAFRHSGMTLIEIMVVIVIIVSLASIAVPSTLKALKKKELVSSVNNAREIHKSLLEFEQDFGVFPDITTLSQINSDTTSLLAETTDPEEELEITKPLTNYANVFLAQLLTEEYVDLEDLFYVKGASDSSRKPDNKITAGKALEVGELGFAYVLKPNNKGLSINNSTQLPILVTPVKDDDPKSFERSLFDKKAVVLAIGGFVKVLSIRNEKARDSGSGDDIFKAGSETIWGRIVPVVKAPR